MLSPVAHRTLVNIGAHSDGYRLAVPVGFDGIPREAVQELANRGLVVVEWQTEYDPNIANSSGWCARLTDAGINYLRSDRQGYPELQEVPDFAVFREDEDCDDVDLFMEDVLAGAGLLDE